MNGVSRTYDETWTSTVIIGRGNRETKRKRIILHLIVISFGCAELFRKFLRDYWAETCENVLRIDIDASALFDRIYRVPFAPFYTVADRIVANDRTVDRVHGWVARFSRISTENPAKILSNGSIPSRRDPFVFQFIVSFDSSSNEQQFFSAHSKRKRDTEKIYVCVCGFVRMSGRTIG